MSGSTDPNLLVLVSLAAKPRHGHAIMVDIREFAGLRLGPGTLYGAISRLADDGLIEAMALDGRRRPYRLTDLGRAALADRLGTINGAVQTGLRRLEPGQ